MTMHSNEDHIGWLLSAFLLLSKLPEGEFQSIAEKINICRKYREWDDLIQFLASGVDYYVMCSSPEKVAITLNEALDRMLATAQAIPPCEIKYVDAPMINSRLPLGIFLRFEKQNSDWPWRKARIEGILASFLLFSKFLPEQFQGIAGKLDFVCYDTPEVR